MTALPTPGPLDNRAPLHNLPAQASNFIGRESELAAVRTLAAGSRLVTLTGAGGAGKTRLALRVAAELADETRAGVWFADLAPLGEPGLVAVTVADVLGIRLEPGRPVLEDLVEAVGGRSLLVLLDNCEHVIGGCAKLADALLRGCPNLLLLATSREPLDVGGERVYRVPSMGLPSEGAGVAEIRASEAVRLLADRAAAQGVTLDWDEPSAQIAGRICRRLDGIPLALELAAARLRTLPAMELAWTTGSPSTGTRPGNGGPRSTESTWSTRSCPTRRTCGQAISLPAVRPGPVTGSAASARPRSAWREQITSARLRSAAS
jgi:hypothetical protein